jgi:hypothetical protein
VFEREVEEQKATAAALEAAARSSGGASGPTLVPVPPKGEQACKVWIDLADTVWYW